MSLTLLTIHVYPVFSQGVGNAAAPRPGPLVLVGTALLALGRSRRRPI